MTLILRYAAKSDVGMVRRENEDSGFAGRTLLAVADGMGGHAAGELASSTAIATLSELDAEDLTNEQVLTSLDDAIVTSAERIAQFIDADPSRAGMGTTLTAFLWKAGRIAVIHVGDSRAYLLREGHLSQITRDHTYVQSLVDAGRISAEEARYHPKRNLLLRAIDGSGVPEGEASVREAQAGDRYLLCSDGLTGVVDDEMIAEVLTEVDDPTAAVTTLVDLALEGGAPDNVTVVVADVVSVDEEEAARETALVTPVVVGAAGERRNRAALPGLHFPDDVGPSQGDEEPLVPTGPAVVGGLAALGQDRSGGDAYDDSEDSDGSQSGAASPDSASRGDGVSVPGPGVSAPPGSIAEAISTGELRVGQIAAAGSAAGGAADFGTGVADVPGLGAGAPSGAAPGAGNGAGAAPEDAAGPAGADAGTDGWARRNWRWLTVAGVVVGGLFVGTLGFFWWLSSQWYVGASGGYVVIYQGVPQSFANVQLSRVAQQTAVEVATLPYYDQSQLAATIDAATEAEAERIVADLAEKAATCATKPTPKGCPPPVEAGTDEGTGSQPPGEGEPEVTGTPSAAPAALVAGPSPLLAASGGTP